MGRAPLNEEKTSRMPRLRLDELLDELQARIDDARGTRDRVHSLLEAVLSVGRELDLTHVLRSIVEAAALLVDARYAALGVIGPDGRSLAQFLTVGMTQDEIETIGPYPSGHGILGELIRRPEPLRLTDLGAHPASYGFPVGHPPMRTFLGVPIRVREEVFGNLYMTDKRGGEDFDAEDEAVLTTLSVAAGVAIDNARLYEASQRQHQWLQAGGEITSSLLSGTARLDVLEMIAVRAQQITRAALAEISVPVSETELRVELVIGRGAEKDTGVAVAVDGTLSGGAYRSGNPEVSGDLSGDARFADGPGRFGGLGPAVAVPLGTAAGAAPGVLLLARAAGEPPFTDAEIEPLRVFAGQAALALELADRRRDAELLALLEDRDRIARDLHDLAIQRLFATGMTLQSAARLIEHAGAAERVTRAVSDLDDTIKIIRSTIFGLRAKEPEPGPQLRARTARTVGEAATSLGFPPRLSMEGLLDTDVPPAVADHLVAVLAEALSNVARHAHATRAEVNLQATGDRVTLTVADNGVGIPEGGRRSGLRNLADRARAVGGTLEIHAEPKNGSRLTWTAPLDH
ncbi:histidine kinase [Streptomyces sp. NRRL B-1568]|nr:histidine kinase [Streptomyces sp. NRRL B-1568]